MFNKAPKRDVHSCDVRPPAPKPKYIDALDKESTDTDYVIPVKKDPKTGLLYTPDKDSVSEKDLEKVVKEVTKRIEDLEDATTDLPSSSQVNKIEGDVEVIQGNVGTVIGKIEDLEIDFSSIDGKIAQEASNRAAGDSRLQTQIDTLEANKATKNEVQTAQSAANAAQSNASTALSGLPNKLDKIFSSSLTEIQNPSESDYLVINSNNTAYRVSLSKLKEIFGTNEPVINHYIGDFDSMEALMEFLTINNITPIEGNYAYILVDGIYTMHHYLNGVWTESTGGKYVLTVDFDSYKTQLASDGTGSFVKSAKGYSDNGTFTEFISAFKAIWDRFEDIKEGHVDDELNSYVQHANLATEAVKYLVTFDNGTTELRFIRNLDSRVGNLEQEVVNLKNNVNVLYTNETPVPQALGGISKGTKFTNKPITEVLDMLLYPYVTFSVSISMSPKNGGVVRTQDNQTVTGCNVSITKGSADITKIEVKYGNTVKATKTSNIGTSNSFTFDSPITIRSSSSVKNLTVTATDSTGASKSATSGTFTFVDPYYYGVTTKVASELTINDILDMTEDVKTKGSKAYTYTMNQQRAVIAYPASYGNLSSIKDANNFEVLDTFNKVTIENYGVNYYVYVLDGLNTATMKYTFSY